MADKGPALLGAVAAIAFVGAAYFFVTLDRQRDASPSKDDTQIGIKLVLFGLVLAGLQIATQGLTNFLAYIFSGAKGGSLPMRAAIPSVLVGGAVTGVVLKLLLPRTNAAQFKQAERYFLAALGLQYGVLAILGVSGVLNGIFLEAPWAYTSASLASTVVAAGVGFFAISRFGALSGWTMPVRPAAPPPMQYPPQGGAPPGGGQPPGGFGGSGGYPPQGGGGYPPQGGGGYPPQGGGGYPPQGGGGYPPQGGGGYPPR